MTKNIIQSVTELGLVHVKEIIGVSGNSLIRKVNLSGRIAVHLHSVREESVLVLLLCTLVSCSLLPIDVHGTLNTPQLNPAWANQNKWHK